MKSLATGLLLLSIALAACGTTAPTAPASNASTGTKASPAPVANPAPETKPAPAEGRQPAGPGQSFDPSVFQGTWAWSVDTTNYAYDFTGKVTWAGSTTSGGVTTVQGTRSECFGDMPCRENGTVSVVFDRQSLRISMTATVENCSPIPGEGCETFTSTWLEAQDADGRVESHGGVHRLSGKANVDTRKPELEVDFEMHSLN